MSNISEKPLSTLRFDPKNARKHTQRNLDTIERSLREVGAGRSLVAASDGTILAGNATLEAAANAGFDQNVIIVETDGSQLVVIKRTDLDADSEMATKLALYDNRAAEFAEWQPERIAELNFASPDLLAAMFTEKEVDAIIAKMDAEATKQPDAIEELVDEQEYVPFKFGDYSGRVNKKVYQVFATAYEREKETSGFVMLDDVINAVMGQNV